MNVYERITAAGLELPKLTLAPAPFKPFKLHGDTLIVSGQLPVRDGAPVCVGKVPSDVCVDDARLAARLCVMNVLGWAHVATDGRLERVAGVLRVGGFVATSEGFADAPSVIGFDPWVPFVDFLVATHEAARSRRASATTARASV